MSILLLIGGIILLILVWILLEGLAEIAGEAILNRISFYFYFRKLRTAKISYLPARPETFPRDFSLIDKKEKWAEKAGFHYAGAYALTITRTMFIAAWRHEQFPVFYYVLIKRGYILKDYQHLFFTRFNDISSLLTTQYAENLPYPIPPGHYMQVRHKMWKVGEDLWKDHQTALMYLKNKMIFPEKAAVNHDETTFFQTLEQEIEHIRSIPKKCWTTSEWCGQRSQNYTIEKQFEMGWHNDAD